MRMGTGDGWSAMLQDAVWNPHVGSVAPPPVALVYVYLLFYMAAVGWVLVSISVRLAG